jgi:hypothetical protein
MPAKVVMEFFCTLAHRIQREHWAAWSTSGDQLRIIYATLLKWVGYARTTLFAPSIPQSTGWKSNIYWAQRVTAAC